ncbi:hypothetical protein [Streptomyces sp. NPDC001781]
MARPGGTWRHAAYGCGSLVAGLGRWCQSPDGVSRQCAPVSRKTSGYPIAGRPDQLFTEDALTLIHTTPRGYPRAVNNLSLQALVDEAAARAAVGEVVGD